MHTPRDCEFPMYGQRKINRHFYIVSLIATGCSHHIRILYFSLAEYTLWRGCNLWQRPGEWIRRWVLPYSSCLRTKQLPWPQKIKYNKNQVYNKKIDTWQQISSESVITMSYWRKQSYNNHKIFSLFILMSALPFVLVWHLTL